MIHSVLYRRNTSLSAASLAYGLRPLSCATLCGPVGVHDALDVLMAPGSAAPRLRPAFVQFAGDSAKRFLRNPERAYSRQHRLLSLVRLHVPFIASQPV